MPTGYTAPIYEGKDITFREFALRCSRGMMALVTMRDSGLDAEIPTKIVPDDYHEKQITEHKAALAAAEAMADVDAEHAAAWQYEQDKRCRVEFWEKRSALRERYRAMLAAAESWSPPTPEHEGLKRFMIEQIQESIRFDCGDFDWPEPRRLSGSALKRERIDSLRQQIERAEAELANERRRCDERNAWLSALRSSLPADESIKEPRR